MAEFDPRDIEQIKDSIEQLRHTMEDFARAGVSMGSGLSNVEKKMLEIAKAAGKGQKALEKEQEALTEVEKAIDLARQSAQDREKEMQKMSRADRRRIQGLVDQYGKGLVKERSVLKQRVSEHKKAIDQMVKQQSALGSGAQKGIKKGAVSGRSGRNGEPGSIAFQRRRGLYGVGYGMRQKMAYTAAGQAPGKIAQDIGDALEGVVSPFKTAAAGKTGPLSWVQSGFRAGGAAKGGSEQLKEWLQARSTVKRSALAEKARAAKAAGDIPAAKKFVEAGKGLKNLGGALGTLSKALGALGKMNWVFALASALTALVKAASNAEKKLTEMNRSFLKLAGPTAGMRNVPKEMKEFNAAVYNLQRNLRLGIKSKDIQEMFGAMSAAGMSLQGVKQNVGDYGKAIYEARTLSIEFGTSMQDMGKMIADAMINLRESLDDVGKSFRSMAFDASKAGIASSKFYQIIESATSGLAFFGNFMETASTMLRSFTKAGEVGLRDAQDAVTGIMKGFEGIDWRKGIKLLNVMGKEGIQMFQEMAGKGAAEIQEIQKKIQEKTKLLVTIPEGPERKEVVNEIERLRDNLSKSTLSQERLQSALVKAGPEGRGDLSELALEISRLAERPVDVIQMLMDRFGEFGPAQLTAIEQLTGIGQKQVVLLEQTLKGTRKGFVDFITTNQELLNTTFKGNKELNDAFADLIAVSERGGDTTEIFDKLFKGMTAVEGMTPEKAENFISTLREALENQMGPALMKLVSGLKGDKSLAEALSEIDIGKEVANAVQKSQDDKMANQLRAEQERMGEIVSRITSGEDYIDIMKDQAEYFKAATVGDLLKQLIALVSKIWKVVSLFKFSLMSGGVGEAVHDVKAKRSQNELLMSGRSVAIGRLRDALFKRTGMSYDTGDVETMVGRGGLPAELLSRLSDKDKEILKKDMEPFFKSIGEFNKEINQNNKALEELKSRLEDLGAGTLFYEKPDIPLKLGTGRDEDVLLLENINKFLAEFGNKAVQKELFDVVAEEQSLPEAFRRFNETMKRSVIVPDEGYGSLPADTTLGNLSYTKWRELPDLPDSAMGMLPGLTENSNEKPAQVSITNNFNGDVYDKDEIRQSVVDTTKQVIREHDRNKSIILTGNN